MNHKPAPTNYIVIEEGKVDRGDPARRHDRYEQGLGSGRLGLRLTVGARGLHVGTGLWDHSPNGKLHKQVSTIQGLPGIPGSGLKGPVRMIAEALTASCSNGCRFDELGKSELCFACRVFGTLGYLGRIGFEQAVLEADQTGFLGLVELPLGYQPQNKNKSGRRFYGPRPEGLENRIAYARLRKGTRLSTAILFDQIAERDLGVVFLAMGLDGSFEPKLGGAKFAGVGAVRFEPGSLSLTGKSAYQGPAGGATSEGAADFVGRCLASATGGLRDPGRRALTTIRETLRREAKP